MYWLLVFFQKNFYLLVLFIRNMEGKAIIIYDNRCLFCINYKNKVNKLDKNKKLKWVGIDDFDYRKYKLKKEDLLKEMHLIFNGKIHKGYYAWKLIARKIPILFPLYLISLIPGIDFIGNKIYKGIAKHRYKL